MKQQKHNKWPTIGFVNRFCQASILMLALAAYLSLGEFITGSTPY